MNPYITVTKAALALQSSTPTARPAIQVLEADGMLQEMTGGNWRRVYLATPILRAIEGASTASSEHLLSNS
ncbi:MAG: hypothetical protein H0X37_11110 [Herpetosiphonaceae bacterium]|nr:hypothetical protein [Herpetosiphonaceae bacterium]